ncbi:MAG TPA: UDP-N-acetylmuramate dehydrogenase [Nitrospiria bacterium]|nr:UDP-N-acetylmuramate dehydrogenase [Nitrospiria bacterium]
MKTSDQQALRDAVQGVEGEILWKEPLSRHTTLRIGGPADVLVIPGNLEALVRLVRQARERNERVFVMGGSNLLVRDGGIRGIVVKLSRLEKITDPDATRIDAEGGVLLSNLARHAMKRGLSGLEFAQGIPGTVGGAVVMNAGTREGEIADRLTAIRIVQPDGAIRTMTRSEMEFGYRSSRIPKGVIVGAVFQLQPSSSPEIQRRMRVFIDQRKATQPLTLPNAGSVFKNPKGRFAAQLVEKVGLKGHRIGDAQVSERHANFIVNLGRATAKDVLELIRTIGKRVEEQTGITLELELRIAGQER